MEVKFDKILGQLREADEGGGTSDGANKSLSNINAIAKELISHLGKPSDVYADLTLGESGYLYTSPADGYICINKVASVNNQYVSISVRTDNDEYIYGDYMKSLANDPIILLIPILKNRKYRVFYDATGITNAFRFIYAEGSKI